ncbi:hypothetical protein [Falsiroseomonas sp. CW058]|uniref:hypothetical protein n=1 Tax=Falsiroseomonas sp. CW058 TaxID=3388664 RepID=UPI003D31F8E2
MTWLFGLGLAAAYAGALGALLARQGPWAGLLAQWGEAALAADGSVPFARFVTAFPPLPYLLSAGLEAVAGRPALPGPLLAAALAGGLLGAAWFAGFRRAGFGELAAGAAALGLALHPFTLSLVASGPGPALAAAASWWLALSLASLRAHGGVDACIGAALALAVLAFSDPAGLLVAAVAPVALLVAAPPLLISRGPGGLLLLLLFPLLFGLAGFAHVAATHGAGALAFLAPLRGDGVAPAAPGWLAAAALVGLPALVALPVVFWRSVPLRQVGAALLLLALAAPLLAVPLGVPLGAPALAAPALGLGTAALLLLLRRGPRFAWAGGPARAGLLLLPFGLVAGGAAVALDLPRWGGAPAPLAELRALAAELPRRGEVLIDLAAMPEVAALRGGGAGLVQPEDDRFRRMAMSGRLDIAVVAVRDPGAAPPPWRPDRVHAAFPRLHAAGAPGYRLRREIGPWRIYERES